MATFDPAIFRAYDVRGIPGQQFDAAFARHLASRVAHAVKAGSFVVGRDGRRDSPELAEAVIAGARHAGATVFDVGEVSTPQFYWAVRATGAAGGVMVTASHNPAQYNGFKAVVRRGDILDVLGGHELRQIYDATVHDYPGGVVAQRDIADEYAAAIAYAAGWQGGAELRIAVDGPPSVSRVLTHLGPIAPDENFGVRFDADADRISFFVRGVQVPADFIFLLLAEQLPARSVVYDLRFSRAVRDRLAVANIPATVSKVGRLYVTRAMHDTGAILGGELSGHFYWHAMGGMEAPELTLLKVYQLCGGDSTRLEAMMAPYRVYANSGEVSLSVHDHKHTMHVIESLAKKFSDGVQSRLDGLTVEYPDWWFNIRASNTEPMLRLVAEAKNEDLLERMLAEVRGTIG